MLLKNIAVCNPKNESVSKFDFINYIDTSSVNHGKLNAVQKLFSNFPSRAQRIVNVNDILISSVRPILRHNYFVSSVLENCLASTGFIQVRLNTKDVLPRYLYYFLTSNANITRFNDIAETSQSTFPSFNKNVIEDLELPNISLTEQQHIVNSINREVKYAC